MPTIYKSLLLLLIVLDAVAGATAQEFEFPGAALADPTSLSRTVSDLAKRVLPVYKEENRETYLNNLFGCWQLYRGDSELPRIA
jgi:hypothetical protein